MKPMLQHSVILLATFASTVAVRPVEQDVHNSNGPLLMDLMQTPRHHGDGLLQAELDMDPSVGTTKDPVLEDSGGGGEMWWQNYLSFWATAMGLYAAAVASSFLLYMRIHNEDATLADHTSDRASLALMETGASNKRGSKVNKSGSPDEVGSSYGTRLRFPNRAMEVQWLQEMADPHRLRSGAATLAVLSVTLIVYHLARLSQTLRTECLVEKGMINWSAHVARYAALLVAAAASVACHRAPSETLYWPVMLFYFFYTVGTALPPFEWSCETLSSVCLSDALSALEEEDVSKSNHFIKKAVANCDCSLQGSTATLMVITWILALPALLPRYEHMHLVWIWLFLVYLGWTIAFNFLVIYPAKNAYDKNDVALRFLVLMAALIGATVKKYYIERAQRAKFADDVKEHAASKRIFRILMYMMPDHVILPMLRDPGNAIAEDIGRVSILFIVIADFEKFATAKTPKELLQFLNDQFTEMDHICARHKVTKIETVCEEYVAAVGVLPAEQEETQQVGHASQVERMFRAAGEILELQTAEVRFKMGVETGPIVAGVIGTKLPRYRLFGNTINTAARMMQKGKEGKVQFGEETKKELVAPDLLKRTECRGLVAMKGKGDVMAYNFGVEEVKSAPAAEADGSDRSKRRRGLAERICVERGYRPKAEVDVSSIGNEPGALTSTASQSSFLEEEREVNKRFQAALQSLDEAERDVTFWGFASGHTEEDWLKWHHENSFCDSLTCRYGEVAIMNIVLLLLEFGYMFRVRAWEYTSEFYTSGELRLPIFTSCRTVALLIRCGWWYVSCASNWIVANPHSSQTLLIFSSTVIIALFWYSYDTLITSDSDLYNMEILQQSKGEGLKADRDQVFVIMFTLVIIHEIGKHDFIFKQSLWFVFACMLGAMIDPLRRTFETMYGFNVWPALYSLQGRCILFANVVMNSVFCWYNESISRTRFRTWTQVTTAQQRTEHILEKLMPVLVVRELASLPPGVTELPSHKYRHATIAQSDLCGFTALSSSRTPQEVVSFMGELFGAFDKLADKHGVYKVETVGDAYLAGMGEQPLTEENSPVRVLLFALDMVRAVFAWSLRRGFNVRCRCGVHYGECIGGIVGDTMQRYHLFGDLLRVIEIMESTAPEARVQVSHACREEVERQLKDGVPGLPEEISFEVRGVDELKTSKGEVHTLDEVGGKATSLVCSNMPLQSPPEYPETLKEVVTED
mmetsp:Transcript_5722/g.12480  ORF Transcript_5722/g.12480 Transcript_5722/m.12480 type:complete len:1207 (-) Transcript_5722:78-3698(-)